MGNSAPILPQVHGLGALLSSYELHRFCISYCLRGLAARWQSLGLPSTPPTEGGNNQGFVLVARPGPASLVTASLSPRGQPGAFSDSTIRGTPVTELSGFVTCVPRSEAGEG